MILYTYDFINLKLRPWMYVHACIYLNMYDHPIYLKPDSADFGCTDNLIQVEICLNILFLFSFIVGEMNLISCFCDSVYSLSFLCLLYLPFLGHTVMLPFAHQRNYNISSLVAHRKSKNIVMELSVWVQHLHCEKQ